MRAAERLMASILHRSDLHLLRRINRFFRAMRERERSLDYRISNRTGLFHFANRWYIVARMAA
jgi:hypothetical protein